MKKHLLFRVLSMVLVVAMIAGFAAPITAASTGMSWKESDREVTPDLTHRQVRDTQEQAAYKPTDTVRVSIVMEGKSTVQAGYSTMGIAANAEAMAYNKNLLKQQKVMEKTISVQALNGGALDVVWNMTLVGNIISANVPYGKIEAIEAVDGVQSVYIERQYFPNEAAGESAAPQMYTSAGMIGSEAVWATGYTGAGSRVAVIDTGTDTDHQSFDNGAFLYALERNAEAEGVSYDEYVESLDLLDEQEIAAVLEQLNAYERGGNSAEELYRNEKQAFGYNYVDADLDIVHDNDTQGSHGSHVAGIAAANRYVAQGDGYADARESQFMSGVAPDAQLLTMKVFGKDGGAFDSDYMAAIEDAIVLGCDAVNLSLGSANAGNPYNDIYADLLDYLETTDTVVVISAGNAGYWAGNTASPTLYSDDVRFDTVGSPGSYTNSLAVASVNNNGAVGKYFAVGDRNLIYTENLGYNNQPMQTLDTSADGSGTEYAYILVDGIGQASDYEGIDLSGKVVICNRGTISFAEKANTAVALGAAAIVICNNQEGALHIDLTGYSHTAPCVSLLQSEGADIKAVSEARTTEAGNSYYTGTLTVYNKLGASVSDSEYYVMSDFSSWGVPGDLSLKPEIAAPGGSIYSVNGMDPSGTAYEVMSGTSMAAPQVAGMVALMAEYIREEGLDQKTGLSPRTLAHSLLMSTSEPMLEEASGGYYSILHQGSGLARVDLAVGAESYVLVNGQDDGKVKVELGDDPTRTGEYAFSFTIHNLNGQAVDYTLNADVFTQALIENGGYKFLDTWTTDLAADMSFSSEGSEVLKSDAAAGYDLNGDGKVDALDADHLLEYLLGNESQLHSDGDVSGDGTVNSYDAHLLLALVNGNYCVSVPANGSVTVDVELSLTAQAKEYLDANHPNGAYLQAFVYAEAVADEEGSRGTTHSIPVLGYYGSWSEPSMYDVGSYVEYVYGMETRVPYLYNNNGTGFNFLTIQYGDGNEYYYAGNPVASEAEYLPQRNAINNLNGTVLSRQHYTLIRNAAAAKLVVSNAQTGEVYVEKDLGEEFAAYFHANSGQWYNFQSRESLGWSGTAADGTALPEGTTVNISLVAAPEYYREAQTADGETTYTVDWDALEDGAYLTTQVTIDNTAPEILDLAMGLMDTTLRVTARDNEYVAAVALMNASGTNTLATAAANQTQANAEVTAELDLTGVSGSKFLVVVYDYAMNSTVYEVSLGLESDRPYFTAYDISNTNDLGEGSYVSFNPEDEAYTTKLADGTGRALASAAEYVDGYVFEITGENKLYVASDEDLGSFTYLSEFDADGALELYEFLDLAFNKADEKLYGIYYSMLNGMATPYLCTIDMYMGTMEVLGEMPLDVNNLAIDGDGNFYSTLLGDGTLYTYTSDVTQTGVMMEIGYTGGYTTYYNSMAWDHNEDCLYWTRYSSGVTMLMKIDPATAASSMVNYYEANLVGLYIRPASDDGMFAPTNDVVSVTVEETAMTLKGTSLQLHAAVWPWNVSDSSVTWSSADESIAMVDENGIVTGVAEGVTTITATSVLDPTKSASCTFTVEALDREMNGLVWDENGDIWWSAFNTDTLPEYTKLTEKSEEQPFAAAAMANDGTLYAATLDTVTMLSDLYTVDPETFEATKIGGSVEAAYFDMAWSENLVEGGTLLAVYGPYILMVNPESGEYNGVWQWSEGADFVGITYAGTTYDSLYGSYMDSYYLVDMEGNVFQAGLMNIFGTPYLTSTYSRSRVGSMGYESDASYFSSAYFDGEYLFWNAFNNGSNNVTMMAMDMAGSGDVYTVGAFADGVWPVAGLMQLDSAASADGSAPAPFTPDAAQMIPVSTDTVELERIEGASRSTGNLNAVAQSALPFSAGIHDEENGTISVEITVPADAANGMLTVGYDAGALTMETVEGLTEAFAYANTDGAVELAYASADTLVKDSVVAKLTFRVMEEGDFVFTVTHQEIGSELSEATEEILVHCHVYTAVVTAPTCTAEGYTTYTCVCGDSYAADYTAMIEHTFADGACTECGAEDPDWKAVSFVDVPEDAWFADYVEKVVNYGLFEGVSEDHFDPGGTMSRAMLVTVLWRMDGRKAAARSDFVDVHSGTWYAKAVDWAAANGIVNGVSGELFAPDEPVTREQFATILHRYAGYAGYDTGKTTDLTVFPDADAVSEWAEEALSWAVAAGIIQGSASGDAVVLDPQSGANRAQAAAMMVRFVKNIAG